MTQCTSVGFLQAQDDLSLLQFTRGEQQFLKCLILILRYCMSHHSLHSATKMCLKCGQINLGLGFGCRGPALFCCCNFSPRTSKTTLDYRLSEVALLIQNLSFPNAISLNQACCRLADTWRES